MYVCVDRVCMYGVCVRVCVCAFGCGCFGVTGYEYVRGGRVFVNFSGLYLLARTHKCVGMKGVQILSTDIQHSNGK